MNWAQLSVQAMMIVVPLLAALYISYKRIVWILEEHRPHTHGEKTGALAVDGIRYPRMMDR